VLSSLRRSMSTFVELGTSRRYKRQDEVGSGNILYISSFKAWAHRLVASCCILLDQAISQCSIVRNNDMGQTNLLSATRPLSRRKKLTEERPPQDITQYNTSYYSRTSVLPPQRVQCWPTSFRPLLGLTRHIKLASLTCL